VPEQLKKYETLLQSCALFNGIESDQLFKLLECLGATQHARAKGDFILRAGDPPSWVGVVLEGSAHIIQEDFWGNRSIVARALPGDLFAESFCCAATDQLPVSVVALEPTKILTLDFNRIVSLCSSACGFHNALIKNMLKVIASKSVELTRKLEDVSQRTTKEKLLSYLSRQALAKDARRFDIPFNRQELADYLSVDRSALSGELSKMQSEGILSYQKNHFELL
jgi:CRP-like cAMP-binding protein